MEVVNIFIGMCFCLVAGYLLGFVQQLVELNKKQVELLQQIARQEPVKDEGLPAGMYAMSEPDPRTGQCRLVPMTQ